MLVKKEEIERVVQRFGRVAEDWRDILVEPNSLVKLGVRVLNNSFWEWVRPEGEPEGGYFSVGGLKYRLDFEKNGLVEIKPDQKGNAEPREPKDIKVSVPMSRHILGILDLMTGVCNKDLPHMRDILVVVNEDLSFRAYAADTPIMVELSTENKQGVQEVARALMSPEAVQYLHKGKVKSLVFCTTENPMVSVFLHQEGAVVSEFSILPEHFAKVETPVEKAQKNWKLTLNILDVKEFLKAMDELKRLHKRGKTGVLWVGVWIDEGHHARATFYHWSRLWNFEGRRELEVGVFKHPQVELKEVKFRLGFRFFYKALKLARRAKATSLSIDFGPPVVVKFIGKEMENVKVYISAEEGWEE